MGSIPIEYIPSRRPATVIVVFISHARLLIILVLLIAGAASAQPTELVARPPALDRLEFFVGTWTLRDLPPDEDYRETCGWVGDRRHLVCRSRQEWPGRVWEGTTVYTYVYADSTLRLYNFAGRGDPDVMTGRVEGEGFVFLGQSGTAAFPSQMRMTITPSQQGYDVLGEQSMGGGPWTVLARFGYLRVE